MTDFCRGSVNPTSVQSVNFGASSNFAVGASGFFFDFAGSPIHYMLKFENGSAQGAVAVVFDELLMFRSRRIFKVIDFRTSHRFLLNQGVTAVLAVSASA